MLKEYLKRVGEEEQGKVIKGVRLISKQHLVGLYQGVGFVNKGQSAIVHGKDSWFELAIDFDHSSATSKSPFVSPEEEDVPKTEMRSPGKRLSPRTSEEEVLKAVKGEGDGKNLWDLYCPRGECRCLLVKKGTAKWVQQHEQDLDVRLSLFFLSLSRYLTPKLTFSPPIFAFLAPSSTSPSHILFPTHPSSSGALVPPFSPLLRKHRIHSFPTFLLILCWTSTATGNQILDLCRL